MVKPADKGKARVKQDADYIFHELTRSICPECKGGFSATTRLDASTEIIKILDKIEGKLAAFPPR